MYKASWRHAFCFLTFICTFFVVNFKGLSEALAHPHVIVSVQSVVVIDEANNILSIRHRWKFDEAFSAFATTGFKKNKDGSFLAEDLTPLAQTNIESLNEYGFFTFLKNKTKEKLEFLPPKSSYFLEYDGKALILNFELPLKTPAIKLENVSLEVYDPSLFVAFDFAPQEPVKIEGAQNTCRAEVSPPKKAVVQRLSQMGEAFFQSQSAQDNVEWAVPVRFSCP